MAAPSILQGPLLVTGGAGFIGSALVWELNRRGFDDIHIADFLGQDEKWKNLVPLRFRHYLEADDLLDQVRHRADTLPRFSCVFHLGACSATTERDAAYLIRNNYQYSRELSDWARAAGARFVYASSAATYGDGSAGMSDTVGDPRNLRPLNMYGYSKHLFDLHLQTFPGGETGTGAIGLKYFNVYGPNEGHKGEMRSLVHKAYGQIVATGGVKLFQSHHPDYRDGEQRRDFLYVKDAVNLTLALAENPAAGGIYNVGSGEANTWLTLARALFTAMGREPKIEFIPMPEVLRGKYQYFTRADITRLRAACPEVVLTPLVDAVRDYVQNYLAPGRHLGDEWVPTAAGRGGHEPFPPSRSKATPVTRQVVQPSIRSAPRER